MTRWKQRQENVVTASKSLFKSIVGLSAPKTDVVNEAGGAAYEFSAKHQLAQYAATGCLNNTYDVSAQDQLTTILELCGANEPEYIAQVALFARAKGYMKDMPALLWAVLSVRSPGLLAEIFDRVIDSPKMLRNFVQIMRSGVVGRKSLGTLPKRLILQWLENRTDEQLFSGSVGNDPSLADVIKMVHPKPKDASREASAQSGRARIVSSILVVIGSFRRAAGRQPSECDSSMW